MTKKSLIQFFRVIISVTFIFSAISKLISLHFFDDLVAELLLGKNYNTSSGSLYYIQIMTRGLIALELLLGAAVMQTKNLKKVILPTVQFMLIVFTLHLFYVSFGMMKEGKTFSEAFTNGNCGCFGDILPMSNLESILKNLVSIGIVTYLWLHIDSYRRSEIKFKSYNLPLILGFITFGSLLMTVKKISNNAPKPTQIIYTEDSDINLESQKDSISQPTEFITVKTNSTKSDEMNTEDVTAIKTKPATESSIKKPEKIKNKKPQVAPKSASYIDLLKNYQNFSNGVKADLTKGKKLVCMFSLSCTHCQGTYKQICEMNDSGKLPNTFLLNNGKKFEENYFYSQAGCQHPNYLIENYLEFKNLLNGNSFPYIIYLEDGKIIKSWTADDLEDPNNPDLSNTDKIKDYFGIKPKAPVPNNSPFSNPDDEGLF